MIQTLTFNELAQRYCERQEATPGSLKSALMAQGDRFNPDGWMLLECVVMDSSRLGSLTILPYGPNNTYKQPIAEGQPISPRGLASDMSLCVGIMKAEELK